LRATARAGISRRGLRCLRNSGHLTCLIEGNSAWSVQMQVEDTLRRERATGAVPTKISRSCGSETMSVLARGEAGTHYALPSRYLASLCSHIPWPRRERVNRPSNQARTSPSAKRPRQRVYVSGHQNGRQRQGFDQNWSSRTPWARNSEILPALTVRPFARRRPA